MFCTGGFDSNAANVISFEESADEFVRAVTGEDAEDPALLGELLMGCPLTNLSSKDPPPPELLPLAADDATAVLPLLPTSTGMRLSPMPLLVLLLLLLALLLRSA